MAWSLAGGPKPASGLPAGQALATGLRGSPHLPLAPAGLAAVLRLRAGRLALLRLGLDLLAVAERVVAAAAPGAGPRGRRRAGGLAGNICHPSSPRRSGAGSAG